MVSCDQALLVNHVDLTLTLGVRQLVRQNTHLVGLLEDALTGHQRGYIVPTRHRVLIAHRIRCQHVERCVSLSNTAAFAPTCVFVIA